MLLSSCEYWLGPPYFLPFGMMINVWTFDIVCLEVMEDSSASIRLNYHYLWSSMLYIWCMIEFTWLSCCMLESGLFRCQLHVVFFLLQAWQVPDLLHKTSYLFFYYQISKRVFELIRSESFPDTLRPEGILTSGIDALYELYKRRTTAIVRRETFLDIVCAALAEYKYVGPNQRTDLILACRYDIDFYLCEDHFDLQLLEENRKKNLLLVTTTSLVS